MRSMRLLALLCVTCLILQMCLSENETAILEEITKDIEMYLSEDQREILQLPQNRFFLLPFFGAALLGMIANLVTKRDVVASRSLNKELHPSSADYTREQLERYPLH